jgi:hypothetical protein
MRPRLLYNKYKSARIPTTYLTFLRTTIDLQADLNPELIGVRLAKFETCQNGNMTLS